MLTGIYNLIIGIVSPILIGWVFIRPLFKDDDGKNLLAQISYSFLSGYGITNIIFTTIIISGHGFNKNIAYLIMIIAVTHFIMQIRKYSWTFIINVFKSVYTFLTKNKIILISLLVIMSVIIFSANWPVRDWDSIALYDFRAKIFADGKRIEDLKQVINDNYYYRYYFVYPYMTSFAHAWTYVFGATTPMPLYAGFYMTIILLLISYAIKYERHSKQKSLIERIIYYSLPILAVLTPQIISHANIAYTNLPYSAYFLAALILVINSDVNNIQENKYFVRNLLCSFLMLSSAILTRFTEPFYISILVLVIYQSIIHRKYIYGIVYILGIYAIRQIWMRYAIFGDELSMKAIPSVLANFNISFFIEVEKFLISHYLVSITTPVFIMAMFALFNFVKSKKINLNFLIFWIINIGVLFLGGFFFAARNETWKDIGGSAERMVMVFIPVFYFWSIYLFSKSRSHEDRD